MLRYVTSGFLFLLSCSSPVLTNIWYIKCSRWRVWMSMLSIYLTSRWTKHRSKGVVPTVLMEESIVCSEFMQFYILFSSIYFVVDFELHYFLGSLYVISLPYWVGFVWEGRTCQERGNASLLHQCMVEKVVICWRKEMVDCFLFCFLFTLGGFAAWVPVGN